MFRGRRYPTSLTKRFPCTDYLDYYDWDLVTWFAERYSRLIPDQGDNVLRCCSDDIRSRVPEGSDLPVQLTFEESLGDMHAIVRRVLSSGRDQTIKQPSEAPRNRRSRRSAAQQQEKRRIVSPVRPKPKPPVQYPTWVFCANGEWNKARMIDTFRPDPQYKLIWFFDGNMLRIHSSEFAKRELVLVQNSKPLAVPAVTEAQIISRQIYIYMCLDGFWEYTFPTEADVDPVLFPYHNPIDPYDPPYGTDFGQVEHAVVQLINSGKLELPTDVEKGDEIVSYIFSEAFDRVTKTGSSIYRESCSSSSSSSCSESRSTCHSKPRVPTSNSTKLQYDAHMTGTVPFDISLKPGKEPENIRMRKSGVQGIGWHAGTNQSWHVHCSFDKKKSQAYFKPLSNSDEDVKIALEKAKEYLRTVLLPQQAIHQLGRPGHHTMRFNPK